MEKEKDAQRDERYTILLFYKYVDIDDPEQFRDEQKELWEQLGLSGRMIVAHEGINATCEGSSERIQEYREALTSDARFSDIHFKVSVGTGSAFPRASIKVRPEIVSTHLGDRDVNPQECTGKRLSPEDLHRWLEEGRDIHIIDMRNDYEYRVGHFQGSHFSGMKNFRDLKKITSDLEPLKNKTVVPVCTGGIRCEKASGYLVAQGFSDVYQLDGGIVSYMEAFPNAHFKGSLYVFDGRVTMHFDDPDKHVVVGVCDRCGSSSEEYADCGNEQCPKHFICCSPCLDGGVAFCSDECRDIVYARRAGTAPV